MEALGIILKLVGASCYVCTEGKLARQASELPEQAVG